MVINLSIIMINLIRIGDDTDHGGKVITASSTMQFDNRSVTQG